MPENVVKVHIVADSTKLEKNLSTLKEKLNDAFSMNRFSLASLNPYKFVSDSIASGVKYVIRTFANAGEELKKQGKEIREEAKALDATIERVANLKAAASAAGVGVQEYADALERIKEGKTTLEEQAKAWKELATSSDFAKERARNFAAIRIAQEEKNEKNLVEQKALDARVKDEDRLRAQLDETAQRYGSRGERHALGVRELERLVIQGEYRIDEETLSKMPAFFYAQQEKYLAEYERKKRQEEEETEKQEEERRKKAQAQMDEDARREARVRADKEAREAQRQKIQDEVERQRNVRLNAQTEAEIALGKELYGNYEQRKEISGEEEAKRALAEAYGLTIERLKELLKIGETHTLTPSEQFRRETATLKEEQKRKTQEREEAEAELSRLRERAGDLGERIRATEGELSASWLTSSGGSLIGSGSYALAMGQRMRAIDREEKQQEMVAELRGVRQEIAAMSKKLDE